MAVRKRAVRKVGRPAAKKRTPAKKAASSYTPTPRVVDEVTGFTVGSDLDICAQELLEGGADRAEIQARVAKRIGKKTRNGTEKLVGSVLNGALAKLLDQGFEIESSFVVVPPAPTKRRAKR